MRNSSVGYKPTVLFRKTYTKLRPQDIAHAIVSALQMDDRGFITDLTVWATNPD